MLVIYLPFARVVFRTHPLSAADLAWCAVPGLALFVVESVRKRLFPGLFSRSQWRRPYPIVAEKSFYATFLSPRRCKRYSLRVTSLPLSVNRSRPWGLVSRPASWINRWRTDAASMKIQ